MLRVAQKCFGLLSFSQAYAKLFAPVLWCHYENRHKNASFEFVVTLIIEREYWLQHIFTLLSWCYVICDFLVFVAKCFDYWIEYKTNDRACLFQYQWLEIFLTSGRNLHWSNCCIFKVFQYMIGKLVELFYVAATVIGLCHRNQPRNLICCQADTRQFCLLEKSDVSGV